MANYIYMFQLKPETLDLDLWWNQEYREYQTCQWMCAESHSLGMPIIWRPFPIKLNITKQVYGEVQRLLAFQVHDSPHTFNTWYRSVRYSFLSFTMYFSWTCHNVVAQQGVERLECFGSRTLFSWWKENLKLMQSTWRRSMDKIFWFSQHLAACATVR